MARLIRLLVTAWVYVLLADGVLGTFGSLWSLTMGGPLLGGLHGMSSTALLLMMPWLWLGWVITPHVPTRVVLPVTVLLVWGMLAALPLPIFLGLGLTTLLTSLLQVMLGSGLLLWVRVSTGGWLLDAPPDAPLRFNALRSLAVVLLLVVVGPSLTAIHLFVNTDLALRHYTAGFARLTGDGLQFATRTYVHDDKAVVLMGMVHIGEQDAYDTLLAGVPIEGTVVVEEGVTDHDHLMKGELGYGNVATALGLHQQAPMGVTAKDYEVVSGDVDLSTFSPETLELLSMVFAVHNAEDTQALLTSFQAYQARVAADPDAAIEGLFDDILHARNRHLITRIDEELADHERVVVPWGAYHMAELSQMLEADGFSAGPPTWRTFVRWRTILGRR